MHRFCQLKIIEYNKKEHQQQQQLNKYEQTKLEMMMMIVNQIKKLFLILYNYVKKKLK